MKTNTSVKGLKITPLLIPTVKSQLQPADWLKKVESPNYRRRIGQMARLLKTLDPLGRKLSRAGREAAHYFVHVMVAEESRRMRSPSERLSDKATSLKDSVRY